MPETRLLVALAAGMLIGAEREQRRIEQPSGGIAGLRTFGLVGLLGGLFGYAHEPLLVSAGALVVGAAALFAHGFRSADQKRGIATELALVVTYAIGVTAIGAPVLAAALSAIVASLLASGERLHQLLHVTLTRQELRDALVLLLFALVLLPIAPDRQVGPYGAINPQSLVRLLVVLMAVSGAGYVAQRLWGARLGLSVMGFAGGFVSSSATIASMGARAHQDGNWQSAAAGALASNVATVLLYAGIVATVDVSLLAEVALPLCLAGAAALTSTLLVTRLAVRIEPHAPHGRAFRLRTALGFATIVTLVGVASAALREKLGAASIVVVSGVAALVDAHSTAGSVASQFRASSISAQTAELAILTALSANSITKVVMAVSSRHKRFALSVIAGVVAIACSAWIGRWLG